VNCIVGNVDYIGMSKWENGCCVGGIVGKRGDGVL
jgi:hypothetical protein